MATAVSMQGVFIKPNIFNGDLNFMGDVASVQKSKFNFDNHRFSDCIASIVISRYYIICYLLFDGVEMYKAYTSNIREDRRRWCKANGTHIPFHQ